MYGLFGDSFPTRRGTRVYAAIKNSGFTFPLQRITVNLAPADLRKEGRAYDLPIAVGSLTELEAAATYFDVQGVTRGEIRDLGSGFGIYVMAVRDPDNIQMELTAPYAP